MKTRLNFTFDDWSALADLAASAGRNANDPRFLRLAASIYEGELYT
jgi:hypothetical protein